MASSTLATTTTTPPPPWVREVSKCIIKPLRIPEAAKEPCYLTSWDLSVLSGSYIQTGLLFSKPSDQKEPTTMTSILDTLKDSLSRTLVHFYPLAGRLATHKDDDSYYIYIDCNNPTGGAEFVHAVAATATLEDLLSPVDVPEILRSFFLYTGTVNHDGHNLPLLGIQITELVDGYFIACSLNHVVCDGTSFWHFFNTWSEITRSRLSSSGTNNSDFIISNPPILKRWFPEGLGPIINLPYSDSQNFIDRFTPPAFRERVFHFSSESMAKLKAKANQDCDTTDKISSCQSLCALLWRCVMRARRVPSDKTTRCLITIGDREKVDPPLSKYYLGNCVSTVMPTAEVGELLNRELGWAAMLCNQAISAHNNEVVMKKVVGWIKSPAIRKLGRLVDNTFLVIGGIPPSFDAYGNDFGWGKPVAIRRAVAIKFDGRISAYPGREGGGGLDLMCCLSSEAMGALESDEEFMSFVSPPPPAI
ncbi:Transferase [Macleaya cordata]|uniref:Transferase n=1 Tax=Macleaya cordata TaxID=56857 RepID=A0A200QZS9_MACCD|nr:Transferase [Macleaya cordata]